MGIALLLSAFLLAPVVQAELKTPAVFGSNMVLQRDQAIPVWGWADAGEEVVVRLQGQEDTKAGWTIANDAGRWQVRLDPLSAGGPYSLVVESSSKRIQYNDVLIGEVWVCSGQSNMQMTVGSSNDSDAEIAAADYPNIRLFKVPLVGTQEPQYDCEAAWAACTPETVPGFSAVGYYFGRTLNKELDVPIGLIQSCWGGSACEAWINRDLLEADPEYTPLMERWEETESTYDADAVQATYVEKVAAWEVRAREARQAGEEVPRRPAAPRNPLTGQHRPANLYNGMILPILPYGIRGAIWYQGESNASRAYQYRTIFPLMITNWRNEWGQGDFPFYFVQLANFKAREELPVESDWAELREAQTMTLDLPNTGQAVTIDVGDASNIHPKDKQTVGMRLALNALALDYGEEIVYSGPMFSEMKIDGQKAVLTFDHIGGGLQVQGDGPLVGFAVAGEDKVFTWAAAEIVGDTVVVTAPEGVAPVAVRYAWANNPACNLYNAEDLPACPFRTDEWPGVTIDVKQ